MKNIKSIQLEKGNFTEYFLYDSKISARVGFNKKLGWGFVSAVGAIKFWQHAPELWFWLERIFGK